MNPPIAPLLEKLKDPAARPEVLAMLEGLSAAAAEPFLPLFIATSVIQPKGLALDLARELLAVRPEWANAPLAPGAPTALLVALANRDLDLFRLLVEHGADPTHRTATQGRNALDMAVEIKSHHLQGVFASAVLGAAEFPPEDRARALAIAAKELNLGAVRALLARQTPLCAWSTGSGDGITCVESALIHACQHRDDRQQVQQVVAAILEKADAGYLNAGWEASSGQAAVHMAALAGNLATLDQLIRAGAWLDPPPGKGFEGVDTPLMAAAGALEARAIAMLLAGGARVGVVDAQGRNAIHHLAAPMHLAPDAALAPDALLAPRFRAALDALVAAGEDPWARDRSGRTPADLALEGEWDFMAAMLRDLRLDRRLPMATAGVPATPPGGAANRPRL